MPLALAVWCVALLCVLFPAVAWGCAAACGLGAVGVLASVVHRRNRQGKSGARGGLVVVVLAAMAAAAVSVGFAVPEREAAKGWDARVVDITAEVTSSASIGRDGRVWFEAVTSTLGPPGRAVASAAPVRLGVVPAEGFDLGATVRVVGESSATDAVERSALVVFASDAEVISPAPGVFGAAATIKSVFVERSLRLPEPGNGLLPGLAVGDTRAVTAELNDDMRTSGLSHLTAVSGDTVHKRGGSFMRSDRLNARLTTVPSGERNVRRRGRELLRGSWTPGPP